MLLQVFWDAAACTISTHLGLQQCEMVVRQLMPNTEYFGRWVLGLDAVDIWWYMSRSCLWIEHCEHRRGWAGWALLRYYSSKFSQDLLRIWSSCWAKVYCHASCRRTGWWQSIFVNDFPNRSPLPVELVAGRPSQWCTTLTNSWAFPSSENPMWQESGQALPSVLWCHRSSQKTMAGGAPMGSGWLTSNWGIAKHGHTSWCIHDAYRWNVWYVRNISFQKSHLSLDPRMSVKALLADLPEKKWPHHAMASQNQPFRAQKTSASTSSSGDPWKVAGAPWALCSW